MPTFSKQERLKSRKTIAQLFREGSSLVAYPLRVVWIEAPPSPPNGREEGAQVAISVSKKTFKTAVERNLIKRRIREAYRLNKEDFYEKLADRPIALMLIYIAKEALPFAEIEAGVKKMIRKFPA